MVVPAAAGTTTALQLPLTATRAAWRVATPSDVPLRGEGVHGCTSSVTCYVLRCDMLYVADILSLCVDHASLL
jgi:hypothetical protein